RIEPRSQGSNRVDPLIAAGSPARAAYEQLLLTYENKADVLRERQLDMVMSGGMPSGVKAEGLGLYLELTQMGELEIHYDADKYYAPEYGDTTATPTTDALLTRADKIVLYYVNLILTSGDLPEGVTIEGLHSSVDVIAQYSDALVHDGDYQDAMFRLRATRAATVGTLERTHRLLDGRLSTADQVRLDKIDADFREYEHQRLIEFGYYLPEEVGMLQSKIGAAQSTAMASLLGEPK